MKTVTWYFDFISPFAYLQSEMLHRFNGLAHVKYQPILFAGLLQHWGQKGPAEFEPKRSFTYQFVLWQAQQLGIPLKMPPAHPFNPLSLLRLAIAAECDPEVIHTIFRFVWRDGRLPDTPLEWFELTDALGLPGITQQITASRVKDALRENTDAAIAAGVFGVPTLWVDGQQFWGVDATEMAIDYLRGDGLFGSDEFMRISALPIGITRQPLPKTK